MSLYVLKFARAARHGANPTKNLAKNGVMQNNPLKIMKVI